VDATAPHVLLVVNREDERRKHVLAPENDA
jgi:hypothetical protein